MLFTEKRSLLATDDLDSEILEEARLWDETNDTGACANGSPLQVATQLFTFETISNREGEPDLFPRLHY